MPGPLLHLGAQVKCLHGGTATPASPNPRVLVSGQPTTLTTVPYLIAGCALPPPPAANGPCVSGQWITGTVRVTSNGQPLAILTGTSVCAPSGTPMLPISAQTRVVAT
jgi:hypothetical protein